MQFKLEIWRLQQKFTQPAQEYTHHNMTLLGLLFYVVCTNDDRKVLQKVALDAEDVVFVDFVIHLTPYSGTDISFFFQFCNWSLVLYIYNCTNSDNVSSKTNEHF